MSPRDVTIIEVGPRDGLQNAPRRLEVADCAALIHGLAVAGLACIEVGAFVSLKRVPNMAASAEVIAAAGALSGVTRIALVPNRRGLDDALQTSVEMLAVFTAASDSFNRKNIGCDTRTSLERFRPVVAGARAAGRKLRAYISTAFGCPYEGPVPPAAVLRLAGELAALGVDELSIGDTIGVARAREVRELFRALAAELGALPLAGHFHDTYGQGLANALAALDAGARRLDASVGGLGGCPFAPGAAGNLATEDLVYALEGQGLRTGVDLDRLIAAGQSLERALGSPLPGRTFRARSGPFPCAPT